VLIRMISPGFFLEAEFYGMIFPSAHFDEEHNKTLEGGRTDEEKRKHWR